MKALIRPISIILLYFFSGTYLFCVAQEIDNTANPNLTTDFKPDISGQEDQITISSGETLIWDQSFSLYAHTVTIEPGGELQVLADVYVKPDAKFIVQRGGKLIIDGATLTSYCMEPWEGIEIWGNPAMPHELPYQGQIRISNSTIENAIHGIRAVKVINDQTDFELIDYTFSGGIVHVDGSLFHNNQNAITFYRYPNEGLSYISNNYLTDCDLIIDDNYFMDEEPDYMVRLNEYHNITFTYCRFLNEHSNKDFGKGLFSFASQFTVTGIEDVHIWHKSRFENMNYGIYTLGNGVVNSPCVEHTDFIDNERGIYCSGVDNAVLTGNNI